jgi:long-chain acyl-CoA synthetase
VEPERIETALKTSPFIEQAVVVGQDRKSLGALVVADRECLTHELGVAELPTDDGCLTGDAVQRLYRAEVDRVLSREAGFRPYERVTRFRVLIEPLTLENGLLTQTLKVKRHVVQERYGDLIDAMFAGT